jgi:hypothetical protein
MLWAMPELRKWVMEADSSLVPAGSLGAAYKKLLVQMVGDPTDKQGLLADYSKEMQKKYAVDVGSGSYGTASSFDDFMQDLSNNFKAISLDQQKKFEAFFGALFDPDIQKTKKFERDNGKYLISIRHIPEFDAKRDHFLQHDFIFEGLEHFPQYVYYAMSDVKDFKGDWPKKLALDVALEVDLRPILSHYRTRVNEELQRSFKEGKITSEDLQVQMFPIVPLDHDSVYELVFMEARLTGVGHVAVYVKSPDDKKWYFADCSCHRWERVKSPGCKPGERVPTPWSTSFYPTKFLYRKKDGQSKTGLQVNLQAFSASLEKLTKALKG